MRLLPSLALGTGASCFVELEIAGGQRPKALARLNRTPAQQDLLAPSGDGADDDLGIIVNDITAIDADHALAVVAVGNAAYRRAARLWIDRHCRPSATRSTQAPRRSAEKEDAAER